LSINKNRFLLINILFRFIKIN